MGTVIAPSGATNLLNTTTANSPLAGKRIHFVGIGGCGMSGLARMVRAAGAVCSGSDMASSTTIDELRRDGVTVALEQMATTVPAECDMLVVSAAIGPQHPEIVEAQRRGIEIVKYAQMLGRLMIGRTGIAVSGTHGKSSTTSMLAHILITAGLDPSFIVGANCKQIGGGSRTGRTSAPGGGAAGQPTSDILVAEACEFDRSFHNFHPTYAVILNVEEDHMEVYGTLDKVVASFAVFAQLLPDAKQGGFLLINHEMPHRLAITAGLSCTVESIGFAPQADWRVEVENNVAPGEMPTVVLRYKHKRVASWQSPMPGEHMAYNAAAAAVLASRAGASWDKISKAIASFQGLDRRMQRMGTRALPSPHVGAVTVVDDYGHHPTEIDTTLRALRHHYKPNRLICVFQPHQHSRTRFLLEQFAAAFSQADIIIVPPIYFVRDSEQERQAVTAADLVDRLRKRGRHAMHLYPFEAIVEQLEATARPGDLVVTMGAGDVWKVAREFLKS